MSNIDPNTGLFAVPDGYRWRIKRSYFMGHGWVVVKLQKLTRFGWHTVERDETKPVYFSWNLSDLWYQHNNSPARRAAAKAKRKQKRSNPTGTRAERRALNMRIRARRRAERDDITKLLGNYPPRKIGDVR